MEVTPGPTPSAPRVRPRASLGSRRRAYAVGAVVVAALAWLLWQGLGNATVFFKTADEAVAQRAKLGSHRFRIEGTVVPGSVQDTGDAVTFRIASRGVEVPIVHHGDEPALFKSQSVPPPVVLEGRFAAGSNTFESDRIIVKHSESYTQQHPDRVSGSANQ